MVDALFRSDGARLVPADFARGPWAPDALHGGPVAALLARAVESCDAPEPVHVARFTVELLRPVPVAPGAPAGEGLPDEAADGPVPGLDASAPPGPDAPRSGDEPISPYRGFHSEGAELRFVEGRFARPGPAMVWVRLAVPVVDDETPSPLQRVAAAADFGNGVSSVLDFARYLFINPDLTAYLRRPAQGEWVGLQASTGLGIPGVGLAQSVLWDTAGPIGRSLQGLVVEQRG